MYQLACTVFLDSWLMFLHRLAISFADTLPTHTYTGRIPSGSERSPKIGGTIGAWSKRVDPLVRAPWADLVLDQRIPTDLEVSRLPATPILRSRVQTTPPP